MNRKEAMNQMLAKVPEDKKEAFIAELRAAKNPEEKLATAKKYDATLTEEEIETLK